MAAAAKAAYGETIQAAAASIHHRMETAAGFWLYSLSTCSGGGAF
jgi:hypothetical protein